jgi:branched-chain amino acid transport system ATP-binding protein
LDALKLSGLHAYYGKSHILQGIDLAIPRGDVVGLFGRNGAGKTTLLRSIMHLGPRVEGDIWLFGKELKGLSPDARAREGIAFMSQEMRVFPELTVEENCKVAANVVSAPRPLDEVVTVIPELKEHLRRPAGRLSGGQQQLVALARCLTMDSRMLMMDEPTEGLMPLLVNRIGEIIRMMAKEKLVTVLLIEQNVGLGLSSCKRIHFMEKGRILASATPDEVVRENMLERYLGVRGRTSRPQ